MKTTMNYNDAKRYVRMLSTVRYVEERPFMIAIVELTDSGLDRPLVAKGLSTCSPTDRWNAKMGQDVARGRAEAKLARRVMQRTITGAIDTGTAIVAQTAEITHTAINGIVYKV